MRILIAEDDAASRAILAGQLAKLGHDVDAAENGEDAWDRFLSQQPEVVITDWNMPETDGLELCRRIRAHQAKPYTYLIILTTLDKKVDYLEGMEAGADDFVIKPCETVDLSVRLSVAQRILSLQKEVKQLEGLLPICPECKKIRDETENWQPVESYLTRRTEAQFSHGICPECFETIMKPQLDQIKQANQ